MIRTIVSIAWNRLRHGGTELVVTFVVPVVFFTIFALIFGAGVGRNPAVRTLLVDADATDLTESMLNDLEAAAGLKSTVFDVTAFDGDLVAEAEQQVSDGLYSAVVVIPSGLTTAVRNGGELPTIRVLTDSSNQVAGQVVGAVVQRSIMMLLGSERAKRQQEAIAQGPPGIGPPPTSPEDNSSPAPVEVVDLLGADKSNPLIAMSAAGIAVMFLLFNAAGAGGSLLEEEESGTLERLLASRLSMNQLLLGKWVSITLLGMTQVLIMFIWGQLVFEVDLIGHIPGFLVMTCVTAGAASSFALLLATACRTRTQLNGVSTILILTMSALGGSMVPRYVMSERMQEWGLVTFNAWALDGYDKVFWRDQPISTLGPQLAVLGASAVLLLIGARVFARRWESV